MTTKTKRLAKIAGGILAAAAIIFAIGACENDVFATGNLVPEPGRPPGGTGGSGMGGAPRLTYGIGSWPTPAAWDQAGEMYEFPNPFIRGNGTLITNPLDWEAYRDENGALHTRPLNNRIPAGWTLEPGGRREEIKLLLEHYMQGTMPPPPDAITVVTNPGAVGGSFTLEFTVDGNTATYTATISIPAFAPNGRPPSPDNQVPLFIGTPAQGATPLASNGWATMDLGNFPSADDFAGPVQTLWNFDNTGDPNRPTSFLRMAWNISRIMDAIEQNPDFLGGVVNSAQIATSGVSRNGKAAVFAGIWAESQAGTRVAISIPASGGSLGNNVERWTSQKAGLNRAARGHNQVRLMNLENYVHTEGPGGDNHVMVSLAPWDWPDHSVGGPNRTQIQVWGQLRNEQNAWVGRRMLEFAQHNTNFGMTGANDASGILGGVPFDMHFVAALAAPNVHMTVDGWRANGWTGGSGWVSQKPLYATHLLAREVFDFLGFPDHAAVLLNGTGHAWPAVQQYAMVDYANWFFNEHHGTDWSRQSHTFPVHPNVPDSMVDRLVDVDGTPRLNVDWYNPLILEDMLRMTWKNPNRTRQWPGEFSGDGITTGRSIADNVRAFFIENPELMVDLNGDPITLDYPESVVRLPGR